MAYEDIDADSREALRRASAYDGDNEPVKTRVRVTPLGRIAATGAAVFLGVTGFNFLSDGDKTSDLEAGRSSVDAGQVEGEEPTLEQLEQRAAEMLTGTEDHFDADEYQGLVDKIEVIRSSSRGE